MWKKYHFFRCGGGAGISLDYQEICRDLAEKLAGNFSNKNGRDFRASPSNQLAIINHNFPLIKYKTVS
jgi:hypothetical protein